MNCIPPLALSCCRSRLRKPDSPLFCGDGQIFGRDGVRILSGYDVAVNQVPQSQNRKSHHSVDKDLADGGNGDRAKEATESAQQESKQPCLKPVEQSAAMNILKFTVGENRVEIRPLCGDVGRRLLKTVEIAA